ncbi:diacylglycerol kinase [Deinococcus metallilatus]|nr:diacylglycerol kinase [Deinococcus metallilatus]
MQDAVLIYNAAAGGRQGASPEELVAALREAGFEAEYRETASEDDLDRVLADTHGTVFVAGGDGTVRGVALRLIGRQGVQLGLIPMGTSNNIATTLEIMGRPLDVARAFQGARVRPLDVGRVSAPWGEDLFLEACGCGAFAEVLAAYDPEEPKSPLRAVTALLKTLTSFEPLPLTLTTDDRPQPEVLTAVLEVMNIKATGNGLRLATTADPSDGRLNVVQVDAGNRDGLLAYLAALARDDFEALPSVQADEVSRVEIPYFGQVFHLDGEVRSALPGVLGCVRIRVEPGALQVLIPPQAAEKPSEQG